MIEELKSLIDQSEKILITSHISPDIDAICSALLLGETLRYNFPGKSVRTVLEEKPNTDLSFLGGYEQIEFDELSSAVEDKPDLIVLVDTNNLARCSRENSDKVPRYVSLGNVPVVAIDHHEEAGLEPGAILFNQQAPAAAQEVYELCFDKLDLKEPEGYAEAALLGIISDSARFKYENPNHKKTFDIVDNLIDAGASIEKLENRTHRYSLDELKVFGELARNASSKKDYTFSYVSDEFASTVGKDNSDRYKSGMEPFINDYLRNVGDNKWGFVVSPDLIAGANHYSVSFRAEEGVKDVSAIARRLGGGGHKPAAGARFKAANVQNALKIVEDAINSFKD